MNTRLISALLLAVSYHACTADWPQFRGPTGQGVADVKDAPMRWSATENIAWKREIPGGGWSSPVLSSNRLYLTTALPAAGSTALRAMCLNPENGNVVWNTDVFTVTPTAAHQKNSHASPTPYLGGNKLYVHFGHYGTAALDLNGKVLWRNTSLKYPPVHGNGGSPIVVSNALIFSCDGARDPFVVALNTGNGEVLWRTPRSYKAKKPFSFTTPLAINAHGRTQVISSGSGVVMSLDPASGKELWRVRYSEGYSVVPRPLFAHGLVYVSSAFDNPTIYAIRPNGSGDVTDTHVAWTITKGGPKTPSMLVVDNALYFVSDAGVMSCADAKTGAVHWQERVGGNYSASPVYAAGRIYVQSEEGVTTVLQPARTFEVLAKNDLGERTLASLAVAEGALYIRGETHLFKVQSSDRR